jgi:N-acetyl-anhydromuramyl-L-alanine amidase AmpD
MTARPKPKPKPEPVILAPLVWRHSPNFSTRAGTKIDLLVYHETAGRYASDCDWLCNPVADASAHAVVREDGGQVTQLVRLSEKAWHAYPAFNARAVGIEHSNITAKGYATETQLRESARLFAWLSWKLDVPVRIARAGHGPGICRHSDLGAAGGGHTQCGMGDKDFLRWFEMIHAERQRGGFRPNYLR